ncbi:MAG: IclR family transcriptional regulator domain-containing protein [Pyrinomonadaceae bacterium]
MVKPIGHVTAEDRNWHADNDRESALAIHPIKPITPKTITTVPRLMAELTRTRERGYAIDDEEHEARVRCIAAPIFAASGEVVAAIGVSGTAGQISDEAIVKIGNWCVQLL